MVVNKDLIDQYLLFTSSHDGSSSIQVMFTPIRVVCNNTLTAATKSSKNKLTFTHSTNVRNKMNYAKQLLGFTDRQQTAMKEAFTYLATKKVDDVKAYEMLELGLGIKRHDGFLTAIGKNVLKDAIQYYHSGIGQKEIEGTAWGVYNAVTGYTQNIKSYKDFTTKFNQLSTGTDSKNREVLFNALMLN